MSKQSKDYKHLHSEACSRGEYTYIDPETGYSVFTELYHKARGKCCNSGCRHCPYKKNNAESYSASDEKEDVE